MTKGFFFLSFFQKESQDYGLPAIYMYSRGIIIYNVEIQIYRIYALNKVQELTDYVTSISQKFQPMVYRK